MANNRKTPIEMEKDEFKVVGHQLIDKIAEFLDTIDTKPVTTGESPKQIQNILSRTSLPENGSSVLSLLSNACDLLFNHSLLNGHPKFFGYITSSAAPIGALADLLASSINPNVGANILSPMATEIEKQTVKWLAELVGISPNYSGILVSGGNMANFTAFRAAITAKAPKKIKEDGITNADAKLLIYCSKTTHIWVEKATVLFGLGSKSLRWIQTDEENKMDNGILEKVILKDIQEGHRPIMIIGTAGDVSTGVVDDLKGIAAICKTYNLWFHIDGAYGAPAAAIPELKDIFEGITHADSIALDPHKWLYCPLEAGCTLIKDAKYLTDTYSAHPDYYNFNSHDDEQVQNYYEYGFQNSRGFRALKVWLALQQVGRAGYIEMISQDISLAKLLFKLTNDHPELQAITQNLSITTFRFIPNNLPKPSENAEEYLNKLNKTLLDELQQGGETFLSNAVIHKKYCLRACIVNFRTSEKDIEETVSIIVNEGRRLHKKLQDQYYNI
jgi:aromatic-L-amino-acid/L-tryptophan decarboxylase